jgi:hypothetical protein
MGYLAEEVFGCVNIPVSIQDLAGHFRRALSGNTGH